MCTVYVYIYIYICIYIYAYIIIYIYTTAYIIYHKKIKQVPASQARSKLRHRRRRPNCRRFKWACPGYRNIYIYGPWLNDGINVLSIMGQNGQNIIKCLSYPINDNYYHGKPRSFWRFYIILPTIKAWCPWAFFQHLPTVPVSHQSSSGPIAFQGKSLTLNIPTGCLHSTNPQRPHRRWNDASNLHPSVVFLRVGRCWESWVWLKSIQICHAQNGWFCHLYNAQDVQRLEVRCSHKVQLEDVADSNVQAIHPATCLVALGVQCWSFRQQTHTNKMLKDPFRVWTKNN